MKTRDFAPRLLPASQAAHYIGESESTLYKLPIPRKIRGAKRLYDRADLAAWADGLPYEVSESAADANSCDALFGVNV